jgi:hypothetical protein
LHTPDGDALLPLLLGFNKTLLRKFSELEKELVLPLSKNCDMLLPNQALDKFL